MSKTIISTPQAPAAIGTYSQAVKVSDTVYCSGQIGLDPTAMVLVDGIDAQIVRVFENLKAVAAAAGASLTTALVAAIGAYGIWQEWWIGALCFSLFLILAMARCVSAPTSRIYGDAGPVSSNGCSSKTG